MDVCAWGKGIRRHNFQTLGVMPLDTQHPWMQEVTGAEVGQYPSVFRVPFFGLDQVRTMWERLA